MPLARKRPSHSMIEWDVGVCMFSGYDVDGFLEVQYDAEGGEVEDGQAPANAGVQPYEVLSHGGIVHRPLDPGVDANGNPDESQAGQLLWGMRGGRGVAIVLGDPRVVPNLPAAQKGETFVYADFGQFTRYTADGSIANMTTTTGGGSDGQTIVEWLTPTTRDFSAPWGRETFDATGYTLTMISGGAALASINMMSIGGLLPGVSTAQGVLSLQADTIELDASIISLGATGTQQMPVVQATPLATALGPLIAALNALTTALSTGLCAAPGSPLVLSGLPAVIAAIQAAQTAITGIPVTCATTVAIG